MKYYERTYIGQDYQGCHNKKVYVPFVEFVKTNKIAEFNKRKKYPFYESERAKKYLLHKETDKVYLEITQLDQKEIDLRPKHTSNWSHH